jgi:hypothetical protein
MNFDWIVYVDPSREPPTTEADEAPRLLCHLEASIVT